MIISKRNFINYSLLFMVIAVSGIPYFTSTILYIPLTIILLMIFLIRQYTLHIDFILLLLLLTIITALQAYTFNFFSIQTTLGVFLRIIIGYLIVRILKERFLLYYINILYYLSIMGTSIYLLIVAIPSLIPVIKSTLIPMLNAFNVADTKLQTIIIYNFNHIENLRNSGPFWEPGAFAGYLLIAIIFIFFIKDIKHKNKKLIVLIFALFTTFSTTAFFAFSIFIFLYFYKNIKNIFIKIIISLSLLLSSYYAYFNFDFLGKKIEHQISMTKNANVYKKDSDTQRFLNIMRDIEDFRGHEIIGRGSNPLTRYAFKHEEQIRTVGITDILVRMGSVFFLIMMYFLYKSICAIVAIQYVKKKSLYCIGIMFTILLTLMSEVYFNFPIYWSLLFMFLIYKPKSKNKFKKRRFL